MEHTVIVADGTGFLGSHLCERLLDEGYEVVCVDNFGSGTSDSVKHLTAKKRFEVVETDLREKPNLPVADEIYHLASRGSPADFTDFPVRIALTSTEGTRFLLDHALEHNATILFASTSEVYGDSEVNPQPESYTGNMNIRDHRGCYDESKRFGETLTVAYNDTYDLDVGTVRIFNTYAPRMRPDNGHVVPTSLSQILRGEVLTVYGDGSQTRTFCCPNDMINGLRAIMEAEAMKGDVGNVGGENGVSIHTPAERVFKICDTDSDIIYQPLPEDDPARRRPHVSKARERLNWEPTVDPETGLEQTVAQFEVHS